MCNTYKLHPQYGLQQVSMCSAWRQNRKAHRIHCVTVWTYRWDNYLYLNNTKGYKQHGLYKNMLHFSLFAEAVSLLTGGNSSQRHMVDVLFVLQHTWIIQVGDTKRAGLWTWLMFRKRTAHQTSCSRLFPWCYVQFSISLTFDHYFLQKLLLR